MAIRIVYDESQVKDSRSRFGDEEHFSEKVQTRASFQSMNNKGKVERNYYIPSKSV